MRLIKKKSVKIAEPPIQSPCVYHFHSSTILPVQYYSDFSIRYIKEGIVETIINGRRSVLRAGSVVMVKPGSLVKSQSLTAITGLSIFFDNATYNNFFSANEIVRMQFETAADDSPVYFNSLIKYLNDFMNQASRYKSLVDQIKHCIEIDTRALFESLERIPRKKSSTRIELFNRIEKVRLILEQANYKFNLNELSQGVCMSKYALIRAFKKVHALSPKQYHITKKMAFARTLLIDKRSVKETAMRCGYPDVFTFSKQFKKFEGLSPGTIRRSR